jgi:hypothetical protein
MAECEHLNCDPHSRRKWVCLDCGALLSDDAVQAIAREHRNRAEHDRTCSQARFYRGLSTEDIDRLPDGYEYPCDCGAEQ